jgi:hypothetical protein
MVSKRATLQASSEIHTVIKRVLEGVAGLINGGRFERSSDRLDPTDDPLLLRRLRREDGDCVGEAAMMDYLLES